MRKGLRNRLVALLTLVGAMVGSLTVATPAHAYGDGLWQWASFNTGNCNRVGGQSFSISSSGDYCVVEGVKYRKDSGGVGLFAQFTPNYCCGGTKAYRVEWHPYGEHLKVCDLKNDSDTIYARLQYKSYNWYWESTVSPPGTSAVVECRDANYSYVEGTEIKVYLYDDSARTDFMAAFYNLRA